MRHRVDHEIKADAIRFSGKFLGITGFVHVFPRVAVIRVAQRAGIPLATVRQALSALPLSRTPTVEDWARLSTAWREELDARIRRLSELRDQLSDCIGCGCLSIERCRLRNWGDKLGEDGAGARLLGD